MRGDRNRERQRNRKNGVNQPYFPRLCILHSAQVASWHFMVLTQRYDAPLPDEGDLLLLRLIMIIVMMITVITNFPCRSRPASCLRVRIISRSDTLQWRCCGTLGRERVCVSVCVCAYVRARVLCVYVVMPSNLSLLPLFPADYTLA